MQGLKKIDLTYILSQEALGAFVLPEQESKQTKRKTWNPGNKWPQKVNEHRGSQNNGEEDPQMTVEEATRRN